MPSFSIEDVRIRKVPPTPVAVITHVGETSTIHATVARLIAWCQANGPASPDLPLFSIFPTDIRATPPASFRMQVCVGYDRAISSNDDGVEAGLIPGGSVATLRMFGAAGDDLEPAALFLYRDWLPASGEALRDFPLYCQRVGFFPRVPAHEAVTDLFLPLR